MTPEAARAEYEAARTSLNRIARSDDGTEDQRMAAREARDAITEAFIDAAILNGEALSAQYATFIAQMKRVVDDISGGSSISDGLNTLQKVVARSTALLRS